MFPWGALVGLAGQAVSGIASAFNNRKMQQQADAEAARQKAYYEAKANENPLSRSENQHLLGQYDRDAQQQIENARGVAAITGATPEYGLAVQKGVAEGRANLMGQMAAGASARKDYFEQKGEEGAHQKALDDQARRAERNQTYANLAANAASAAGSIIDAYTGFDGDDSEENEQVGDQTTKDSYSGSWLKHYQKKLATAQAAGDTKGVARYQRKVDYWGNKYKKYNPQG